MQLRANGHDVYGFGERKTPDPFVNGCTTFLYLDRLGEEEGAVGKAEPTPSAALPSTTKVARADAGEAKGNKPLSQDAKLVAVLRGAVQATAGEDGWAPLAAAGSAVKRQAPIDPRNYGARNFSKLFEAVGLFDIVKAEENGQSYVADRKNKDRAASPRF